MNIVLDEAFEEKPGGEKVAIGMVVSNDQPVHCRSYLFRREADAFFLLHRLFEAIQSSCSRFANSPYYFTLLHTSFRRENNQTKIKWLKCARSL